MRIIAGQFKGRKLFTPEDASTIRPTSDRAREAIFNLLMHGKYAGEAIRDQHVVDLCCGTGALGLEALSRGARMATFVDQDKRSIALAKQNALHCNISAAAHFVQCSVSHLPPAREPAALVLMDAPYATPLLPDAYTSLRAGGWLAAGALLATEHPCNAEPPLLPDATLQEARQYGKAKWLIYQVASVS